MAPTVLEVSNLSSGFLVNPPAAGEGVCQICWTFCAPYPRCYPCGRENPDVLDLVVPITMSAEGSQTHMMLRQYKDGFDEETRRHQQVRLTAILWRWLEAHEGCIADRIGQRADFVTTVPSGDPQRDDTHPLRKIVGEWTRPTRDRYRRILRRTDVPATDHVYSAEKYQATESLDGKAILLIEDTWTKGANSQAAATALRDAGASSVVCVVIGRHINPDYSDNKARLAALPRPFDWDRCALC